MCPVPLWQLGEYRKANPEVPVLDLIIRLRLFEDPHIFAEFTVEEMIALYSYRDVASLVEQFAVWRDCGALTWIREQRAHQELLPFSDYGSDTMLLTGRVKTRPDARRWGPVKFWGERCTPIEPWEHD
ncbi:hypothetical protein [Corynebacterium sp. A21]|uniref:hypothetical protein n=1 Tax=Corynebacterium sp. A21 TaxID=3457318 RepID=UPI003FD0A872